MRPILRRQERRSESGDWTIQRRRERLIDAFERSILRKHVQRLGRHGQKTRRITRLEFDAGKRKMLRSFELIVRSGKRPIQINMKRHWRNGERKTQISYAQAGLGVEQGLEMLKDGTPLLILKRYFSAKMAAVFIAVRNWVKNITQIILLHWLAVVQIGRLISNYCVHHVIALRVPKDMMKSQPYCVRQ
jgi:hypothetical protein